MILGVKVIELETHVDKRGFFREILRFPDNNENFKAGQLSHSQVKEGIVKAWHGHVFQYQWNYVIQGQIKVALVDNRKESDTYRDIFEFKAGDGLKPIAYFFPPGVLHGYRCIKGPMQNIYLTSGTYTLDDEIRKSNKEIEINYKWN